MSPICSTRSSSIFDGILLASRKGTACRLRRTCQWRHTELQHGIPSVGWSHRVIHNAVDWRCWRRRLVTHHTTSVFDEFNWSLFDVIQLTTSLRQSVTDNKHTRWHWQDGMCRWLECRRHTDVVPCHVLQSVGWGRSCISPCWASSQHSRRVMMTSDRRALRRTYCVRAVTDKILAMHAELEFHVEDLLLTLQHDVMIVAVEGCRWVENKSAYFTTID